jgi:hypothetical protein
VKTGIIFQGVKINIQPFKGISHNGFIGHDKLGLSIIDLIRDRHGVWVVKGCQIRGIGNNLAAVR